MAGSQRADSLLRRYPPLVTSVVGVALAVLMLPSALNVPLTNPSQTLEYAPVPPQDGAPPDAAGNTSSLSLGSSGPGFGPGSGAGTGDGPGSPGAVGADGAPPGVPLPPDGVPPGGGSRPVTKRCVGNPPRQTEDPMSPPCVAFFDGDNGGKTHRGVDGNEIRALIVTYDISSGTEPEACDRYFDPHQPPDETPLTNTVLRIVRGYERYFNDRFQTYGRKVKFQLYVSCGYSPEERRAEAAANVKEADPFAVVNANYGNMADYLVAVAGQDVLAFGTFELQSKKLYDRHPGYIWNREPTIEHTAGMFVDYLCAKVIPYKTSFGQPEYIGRSRKLGLLYTDGPVFPEQQLFNRILRAGVAKCGGEFVVERSSHFEGRPAERDPVEASQNMAAFQGDDVTTIVWTAASTHEAGEHADAAGRLGYTPEIIAVSSQPAYDNAYNSTGRQTDQSVWRNAWLVTPQTYRTSLDEESCARAIREGDPEFPSSQVGLACDTFYARMFQLYQGIQVAGPNLTPDTVAQGFHAIPAVASANPRVPACFYPPGEHTCVQDAAVEWWDPEGRSPNPEDTPADRGCWRMARQGARFLRGEWPQGDVLGLKNADKDFCNGY